MSYGRNITINTTDSIYYASRPDVLAYFASNRPIAGTYVNQVTATFNKGWYQAPSDLPSNNSDQFVFFVNGSQVEHSSIVSFVDTGGTSILTINGNALGYLLEPNDTIIAIGKFA